MLAAYTIRKYEPRATSPIDSMQAHAPVTHASQWTCHHHHSPCMNRTSHAPVARPLQDRRHEDNRPNSPCILRRPHGRGSCVLWMETILPLQKMCHCLRHAHQAAWPALERPSLAMLECPSGVSLPGGNFATQHCKGAATYPRGRGSPHRHRHSNESECALYWQNCFHQPSCRHIF